jgi:DNA repair ATPase RecN
MIREIVESAENTYVINFPKELVGKKVEITASEVVDQTRSKPTEIPFNPDKLKDIQERYDKLPRISHENYKFDRDEANNYE